MRVQSLGQEDPLEEGMAIHSSILAWRIPMDRGTWQMGSQRVGHNWSNLAQHSTYPIRLFRELHKILCIKHLEQWLAHVGRHLKVPEATCVLKGTRDVMPSEPGRCNPQPPGASVHRGAAQAIMRVTGCGRGCRGGGCLSEEETFKLRRGEGVRGQRSRGGLLLSGVRNRKLAMTVGHGQRSK